MRMTMLRSTVCLPVSLRHGTLKPEGYNFSLHRSYFRVNGIFLVYPYSEWVDC